VRHWHASHLAIHTHILATRSTVVDWSSISISHLELAGPLCVLLRWITPAFTQDSMLTFRALHLAYTVLILNLVAECCSIGFSEAANNLKDLHRRSTRACWPSWLLPQRMEQQEVNIQWIRFAQAVQRSINSLKYLRRYEVLLQAILHGSIHCSGQFS
jgi:hypothetical protein